MSRVFALLTAALVLGVGCARDGTLGPGEYDGLTRILLTDAPFPFDQVSRVDVFVVSVAVTETADTVSPADDWVTIAEPGQAFNLLELQRGTTAFVGEASLPAGMYEAIRLVIDVSRSGVTMTDGTEAVVDWQNTGELALRALVEDPLDVPVEGASIVIDFDVGRSFLPVGGGFVFLPWIRAVNEAATGSLAGTVRGTDGPQEVLTPVANASVSVFAKSRPEISGAVPVATARTNGVGEFVLPFLVAGSYTVQVAPPAGFDAGRAVESSVSVAAGGTETLDITLPPASETPYGSTLNIHGNQLLSPGESATFTAYLIREPGDSVPATQTEWHTSNSAIASITGSGNAVTISGGESGIALILASCLGATDSLLVTVGGVVGSVETVELTPASQTISVGDSTYVEATVRDANGMIVPGEDVTWTLSNSSTVSLMEGGSTEFAILRGLGAGAVTVTGTADGKTGSATVVVN